MFDPVSLSQLGGKAKEKKNENATKFPPSLRITALCEDVHDSVDTTNLMFVAGSGLLLSAPQCTDAARVGSPYVTDF